MSIKHLDETKIILAPFGMQIFFFVARTVS